MSSFIDGIVHLFQDTQIVIILLLSLIILILIFGICVTFQRFKRSQEKEAFLQANLIKLKDAVLQAERKSMNKSLAFASASHDVRTSLAGITGLIELCRNDVTPHSELDANLIQMNSCASKLLGILNSVLDMSKVEAGKMQLEEVEFSMSQVLEETVDIFHVVALKKGLEVIWDPCDFSILKSLNVKGDCKRLKQILDNLLGNAVKFTSNGHVVLRAWAKKPSLQASNRSFQRNCRFPNIFGLKSSWPRIANNRHSDMITRDPVQYDSDLVEFVFEIDDTGIGIPKEKRASIFENYVQVKESSLGEHEGTGLGLGIVQSFVRLMGGEINIQDKAHDERGTCFKFNIFIKSCETTFDHTDDEDKTPHNHETSSQLPGLSRVGSTNLNARAMAFRMPPKTEGMQSLLLIEGDETKRILQRLMEDIGMKAWLVHKWELLHSMLEKASETDTGSGKFDSILHGHSLRRITSLNSNTQRDVFHSFRDERDQILPVSARDFAKKKFKDSSTCILIVIDISCGDFSNICSVLNTFSKANQRIQVRVIWLVNANTQGAELRKLKQRSHDLVLKKPIHGSRLYAILRLLQDLGSRNEGRPSGTKIQDMVSCNELDSIKENNQAIQKSVAQKPLDGKKILLVEDVFLMRRLASATLSRLGASVEFAENGLEALNLIKKALQEVHHYDERRQPNEVPSHFPYDVILMDCEMPVMNGYDATRNIREEEKSYGVHIPIIALTAHATVEEEKRAALSGMDSYLMKPINQDRILEAFTRVFQN